MFGFLKHLFIPHEKNNHRAKILHNSSIFIILVLILALSSTSFFVTNVRPDILGISYSISDGELLTLVNQARQDRGLAPLNLNSQLSDAARRKAQDMLEKNYWAHFSPDGSTSPWAFIKAAGYSYTYAGENLAKGFTDSGSIVSAWMNSQTHRDNMLSGRYSDVGFAIVPGSLNGEETVLIVEMFGATTSRTLATVPQAAVASSADVEKKPNLSPTTLIIAQATITPAPEEKEATKTTLVKTQEVRNNPKIDAGLTSKAISTVGLSFLAFAFMMDLVIVERKKIPRIVGHNIDHIMLILMFLLFLVLRSGGVII